MSQASSKVDALVRQAFGLLIEIRHQGGAAKSLTLANAFLRMLARNPGQDTTPLVISFKAIRVPENHEDSASTRNPKREV
jgi:hypothetical protein